MAMNPFDAQLNRQHLAAIIAQLHGMSAAPAFGGFDAGQQTFGPPPLQSYALPGGPPQGQYTMPMAAPIHDAGPYGQYQTGDYIPGIGIKGLGGAVGIKQEALDDGWFHDSAGDHDVRSQ